MKHPSNTLFLICLLWGLSLPSWSTTISVLPITGAEWLHDLSMIGKLIYQNDSLYLYDDRGNILYKEHLKKLRIVRYNADDAPTAIAETQSTTSLQVYPNPATSIIVLENTATYPNCIARLYNQHGQLLKSTPTQDIRTTLDISDLATGTYILLCGEKAFKIIKK